MSTIDLERLRVRQTYFVPTKREKLTTVIVEELEKFESGKGFYSIARPWFVTEHDKSITFQLNYRFVHLIYKGKRDLSEAKKILDAYDQKLPESFFRTIEERRSCTPDMIYVDVTRSEETGCEIEVECLPNLYRRFSQIHKTEIEEHLIQDAYISCKRFLRTVFVGGLSGTAISEKKITIPRPQLEFLINDVSTRQITEKVSEMLNGATGEVLIFGWMGTILLKKLQELKHKGIEVKLVTGLIKGIKQDVMRKEKEKAMKELISMVGKDNISLMPEFHGRAVVVDNKALIGSMDLDSYSLTGTRIEFATYTEDPEIVRSLRNYFKRTFVPWNEEKHKSK